MIRNILVGIAFIAAISSLVISVTEMDKKPVFIDLGEVYKEFLLSKELNKDLEKVYKSRKEVLDTLYETISKMKMELRAQKKKEESVLRKLEDLQKEYLYREEQFQKENQITSNEYNAKIMNQLNQYVEEYGKVNHCTILFGANGQGNIMYADDSRDLTKEVTEYINERYNGHAVK
jgi:outer membrane protein